MDGPPKQPKLDVDVDEEEYDIPEEIEEVIGKLELF